jgi:uncharacterized lipoprotein YbaY
MRGLHAVEAHFITRGQEITTMRKTMLVTFATLFGSALAAQSTTPAKPKTPAASDTSFVAMQARGKMVMEVDQYTSVHKFDALPDGGRIELQAEPNDTAGIAGIREHIHHIAMAFASGDFSAPAFVHMQDVPGTKVMAAKSDVITYQPRELPRGAELRITTSDPAALKAIHDFMAFQRDEHHAGGKHEQE